MLLLFKNPSGGVSGIGHNAQLQKSLIALPIGKEVFACLHGSAQENGKYSGGHWVQCAGVPHLLGGKEPTDFVHRIVGGHAGGFV